MGCYGKIDSISARSNTISIPYSIQFTSYSSPTEFNTFLHLLDIILYLILFTETASQQHRLYCRCKPHSYETQIYAFSLTTVPCPLRDCYSHVLLLLIFIKTGYDLGTISQDRCSGPMSSGAQHI